MTNNTKVNLHNEKEKGLQQIKDMGIRLMICAGTGCVANGSLEIIKRFNELGVQAEAKEEKFSTVKTGCHGFCEQGVLIEIPQLHLTYVKVKLEDVDEIVEKTILKGEHIERLLYKDPSTNEYVHKNDDINFYAKQTRTSLSKCGKINPEVIHEYFSKDGYAALEKVLNEYSQDQVCQELINSGLRGRGGGGFPTGRKWMFVKDAQNDKKYVICNGDEGDPGAFMDRSIMEGDPHAVIEGMCIAAYATGADEGYIYVRAEYPLAVQRLRIAIKQAEEYGLLGENILGKEFNFKLKIKEGAGAFVCGEETALIASIEGERGMPRPKPPFPATSGLFGKPTLINNVETFANVSLIILKGSKWFKDIGTDDSAGTKTFAITGEINNSGLIEVPMGTSLRKIVFDIGGGVRNGKKFKAVQIGGPSGGCLTEEHLDLNMDYKSLQSVGAMVGSGGLVVMSEDTCIVEVARFFMEFTQNESCGKCIPCREGTKQMLKLLEKIVQGRAILKDLELLEELAYVIKDGSLCGLGKTAPNPVLSTLKYFKDEYLAHIVDKKCPAGVCEALKTIEIEAELCKGCSKCARTCPVGAIEGKIKEPFTINQDKCIKCGACVPSCPFKAIKEVA